MNEISFSELDLSSHVMEDLEYHGFQEAMPIQAEAIPYILDGYDLIAQAKTGTGKTLAFAIPIVEKINPSERVVQSLIITPTRELALQVSGEMKKIGYKKGLSVATVYGGRKISTQAEALAKGAQIVVGTPGRILDLINRRILRLDRVKMLVLDEADRMLDMGFIIDIRKILSHIPKERQTMLFSATIGERVTQLAQSIARNPHIVATGDNELLVEEVEQCYYEVSQKEKLDVFLEVVRRENPSSAIIFCNTKRWAETFSRLLRQRGFNSQAIHGDLTQKQRERVMEGFREKKFKFLIATDVAARGLDIDNVSHVFNYDVPKEPEGYVHRIGRTARAGASGKAVTFICPNEVRSLWDIENRCETKILKAEL